MPHIHGFGPGRATVPVTHSRFNICKVPRKVLKTEGKARDFQPLRGTLRMQHIPGFGPSRATVHPDLSNRGASA